MSTYKDVEPIIEKLKYEMEAESKVWTDYDKSMIDVGLRVAMDIIREQSIADVMEVKHGNWIECGDLAPIDARCKCSLCSGYDSNYYGFCHNCGAKMDGGDGE